MTATLAAREAAARWFVRMRNAPKGASERTAFDAWLAADPRHAQEYAAFEQLWSDFDSTASTQALADAALASRTQRRRRRIVGGLLGAGGLGSLGWLLVQGWQSHLDAPQFTLARTTRPGQRLRLPLPDGSEILLGGASAIMLRYSRRSRQVELVQGEALFSVAGDATRPFTVDCADTRTTVVGTRFAVDRLPGSVRVSVQQGIVHFAASEATSPALRLHAGEVGAWSDDAPLGSAPQRLPGRHAQDAFAIERDLLIFERASLVEIAATLSRYHSMPVQAPAGAPDRGPRITAAVQLRQIDGFIDTLPRIAAVKVQRSHGMVILSTR